MCCIPVPAGAGILSALAPLGIGLVVAYALWLVLTHYFTALLLVELLAVTGLVALAVHWVRRDARDGFSVEAHNARAAALSAPEPVHQPRAHKTHARCTYRAPVPPLIDRGNDPDWAESTSVVPAVLQDADQR